MKSLAFYFFTAQASEQRKAGLIKHQLAIAFDLGKVMLWKNPMIRQQ
jgi:hypothetical protein